MPTTVLVVDDERQLRGYCKAVLTQAGFEVVEAEDGVEAYEWLERHAGCIALLISDVQMPRMDGLTLADKVRDAFPSTPILMISGFSSKPSESLAKAAFLRKPFSPNALMGKVQTLITT